MKLVRRSCLEVLQHECLAGGQRDAHQVHALFGARGFEFGRGGDRVLLDFLGVSGGREGLRRIVVLHAQQCRLGLAEIPAIGEYTSKGVYESIESDPEIRAVIAELEKVPTITPILEKKYLRVTELGKQFAAICVVPKP